MRAKNQGISERPVIKSVESDEDFDKWDPMKEAYNSSLNTLAINLDKDPEAEITGRVAPNVSQMGRTILCEHYLKHGECVDEKFCSRLHVDPRVRSRIWSLQNQFENNKDRTCINYTYLAPYDFEPDPERLLLVYVTGIFSPNNFYFIAPYNKKGFEKDNQEELDFFIQRVLRSSEAKTKLENIHKELAALFDHTYRIDNVNDKIYLSQIVACKLKDGHFRRAMVTKEPILHDEVNYKLLLLDVGVEVEVPRELIYDIKAYCLNDPPLAVNCRLDLVPANNQCTWSEKALEMFKTQAGGERFWLCKIINHIEQEGIFTVELYNFKTREALSELMIESGLAQKCPF